MARSTASCKRSKVSSRPELPSASFSRNLGWVYELEADCTITAEYILMMHFMDEVDEVLERKIANYLCGNQVDHGGWSLYPAGGTVNSSRISTPLGLVALGLRLQRINKGTITVLDQ